MCEEIGALYLGLDADPREKATQNETAGEPHGGARRFQLRLLLES
jgi:hypothetical protein